MSDKKEVKTITVSGGLKLKLKKVEPTLIQRAMNSVNMPERPTYEVKTMSGRIEQHPMDDEVAKELLEEGDTKKVAEWEYYKERTGEQELLRNDRVMNALFLKGVEFNLPKDDDWIFELEMIGITVPDNERARKLEYLKSQMTQDDLLLIMTEMMDLIGLDEEAIKEMQDSFPSEVRDGEGSEQVEDA